MPCPQRLSGFQKKFSCGEGCQAGLGDEEKIKMIKAC